MFTDAFKERPGRFIPKILLILHNKDAIIYDILIQQTLIFEFQAPISLGESVPDFSSAQMSFL